MAETSRFWQEQFAAPWPELPNREVAVGTNVSQLLVHANAQFRGHFGPEHGFRIYGCPFLVVGGYPRFQYGGYWFSLVDPWPEYWANDWYDTDDVYVNYVDNGYYLFNRSHPNVGIAINISL